MKKIIAFGASSSKNSINKQLATFAANQFQNASVEILDLNDYEMPVFSVDKQAENGIHPLAHDFYAKIGSSVLDIATKRFPFQGGIVKGSFSLPSFNDNFDAEKGITNEELKNQLLEIVNSIEL